MRTLRFCSMAACIVVAAVAGVQAADPKPGRHQACFVKPYNEYFSYEYFIYTDEAQATYRYTIGKNRQTVSNLEPLVRPAGTWDQGVQFANDMRNRSVFPLTSKVVSAVWTPGDRRRDTFVFTAEDGSSVTFSSEGCAGAQYGTSWNTCPLVDGRSQHCWSDEYCCGYNTSEARCCPQEDACTGDAAQCYSAGPSDPPVTTTTTTTAPQTTNTAPPGTTTNAPTTTATPSTTATQTTAGPATTSTPAATTTQAPSTTAAPTDLPTPPAVTDAPGIPVTTTQAPAGDGGDGDPSAAWAQSTVFAGATAVLLMAVGTLSA